MTVCFISQMFRKLKLSKSVNQGSAILLESVRNRRFLEAWNRYRNLIVPIPGIGIDSLEFSLELESNMVLSTKQIHNFTKSSTYYMFYQFKSGPILCKYRYKRSLLSYLWTSPYKGRVGESI